MSGKSYTYESLKKKYMDFTYPFAQVIIGGNDLKDNSDGFIVSEVSVELTSGYEASAAVIQIYGCFDVTNRRYLFEKLKKYILLGSDAAVHLGYGGIMTEVFRGFVAQVCFVNGDAGLHHVEVTALDAKGMMMSGVYSRQLKARSYGEAVKEIFNGPSYQKMSAEGIYTQLRVTDTPDKKARTDGVSPETIEMVSESDYEFAVKAARRFHYEFFVDDGTVLFRKAGDGAKELIALGADMGLLNYDISYDITGLVQEVEARGTDHSRGGVFSASSKLKNKISTGNKAKALLSGTKHIYTDSGIHSREQAQYRADALAEETAVKFGGLRADCPGLPELKPGNFVATEGLAGPADNIFYITNVVHRISDEEGYHTRITGNAGSLR